MRNLYTTIFLNKIKIVLISCHTINFSRTNDMTDINTPNNILTEKANLNKSRVECFALMILVLIQSQSSNLKKLTKYFITDPNKIQKLLAVMSLAFCCCYKMGIEEDKINLIKRKNNGRLSKSLFRLGLDLFHHALKQIIMFNRLEFLRYLLNYIFIKINPIP